MHEILLDGKLLYYPGDTISSVTEGKITESLNDSGYMDITVPPTNPLHECIYERKSVITVTKHSSVIWEGVVVDISETMKKEKKIYASGVMSYLNDSLQEKKEFLDKTPLQILGDLINEHNRQVETKKQFVVGVVTIDVPEGTINLTTNYESTLTVVREKICEEYGGYIRIRWVKNVRYLDIVKIEDYGKTCQQPIQFGRNLLKYARNLSAGNVVTCAVPLGAEAEDGTFLTVNAVNNGLNYLYSQEAVESFGWIRRAVHFPDITDAGTLLEEGEKWLAQNQYAKLTIEINAVDLSLLKANIDSFHLGDYVNAKAKPFGLDTWYYIRKKTTDLIHPDKNVIVIGDTVSKSYTQQIQKEVGKLEQKIPNATQILLTAKQNATNLINMATTGYIVLNQDENGNPKELLIMDTPDIKTAKKVWRWNINGLGYSSAGYDGEYGTAITMDGAIVADFITAGTMFADRIKGGTFTAGGFNNENGVILVKDSEGRVLITLNKDGITFSGGQKIKYSDISGTPSNISDFSNDSGFIDGETSTEIARNQIRTAYIVCSQLKGGTISLGGSTTEPANLKLFNEKDELIGLWNVDGMYSKSKVTRYSEFSDIVDFRAETFGHSDIQYLRGTHSNGQEMLINRGTMRVYVIIPDNSTSTLETNVVENAGASAGYADIYYKHTYTINKNSCRKCYPDLASDLEEYYALELNDNAYFIDIDMMQLANDLKTEKGYINWIAMSKESDTAQIAGIRFMDRQYVGKDTYEVFQYDDLFIKNAIRVHAKQVQIDTLRSEIDIGDIEIKPDLIEFYPDAKLVGRKPAYYQSFDGIASWDIAMIISTQKILHQASYGNASSTSGAKSLYVQSDGTFISSSSSGRYKENISYDVDKYHCEGLYDVNVAEYRYKDKFGGGDMEMGLIAEDVAEHFPHGAIFNKDGTVESWSERTMIPALLKLIQEQNKRIKKLEKEVLEKCPI